MTVFTKDPRSPEVIALLQAKQEVLLEVTVKQLFILHAGDKQNLEHLVEEWFVKYRGRSHAYRDGSHIGGADELVEVKNLTTGQPVPRWHRSAKYPGYEECVIEGHLHTRPVTERV